MTIIAERSEVIGKRHKASGQNAMGERSKVKSQRPRGEVKGQGSGLKVTGQNLKV